MSYHHVYEYGMLAERWLGQNESLFLILNDSGENKEEVIEGNFYTALKRLGTSGWRLCAVRYAPNGYQQDAIFIRENLNFLFPSLSPLPTKEELQAYKDSQEGEN